MKTRALALFALALGLGGCRENLTSVQANGFCWPPDDAETCGVPSCDTFVSRFEFASGATASAGLYSWIQWENHMDDNSVDGERLNTNDFTIDGYDWEINSPVGTTKIRNRFASTMPIKAGGSAIIGLEVIPPEGTFALSIDYPIWQAQVVGGPADLMPVRVNIKAFGTKGDDTYYETGTVSAAVYFFNGTFTYTCPTPGDTFAGTCPPAAQQLPVTLNCVAPTTTTP